MTEKNDKQKEPTKPTTERWELWFAFLIFSAFGFMLGFLTRGSGSWVVKIISDNFWIFFVVIVALFIVLYEVINAITAKRIESNQKKQKSDKA